MTTIKISKRKMSHAVTLDTDKFWSFTTLEGVRISMVNDSQQPIYLKVQA